MNIDDINSLSVLIFIETFKNIFEKTESITQEAENLRPYRNKKHMIDIFLSIFDLLSLKKKLQIINNHPDLGDKIKINKGLTKLSQEEQSLAGLKDCTEEEFELFNKLNFSFKSKFNIPFIYAIRGKNKNDIFNEFQSRLINTDIDSEIDISIEQVKRIALLRMEELING
jgi:2-oxo-4-hydroxy-4-carboxy-5-ureidoimidazoline decarboxylase|tara:strand:- start:195 stop:704 length:510 start_codon:yes stop_codon:yes gene_type:complete